MFWVKSSVYSRWQCLPVAIALILAGCGDSSDSEFDELALLDQYDLNRRRHDPEKYVEVELGEFNVSRRVPKTTKTLYVRCHLFAVADRLDEDQLHDALLERKDRMRDAVISILQKMDQKALAEPNMNWMKSEMIPVVNKALKVRSVRDIVTSSFSLERV